MEARARSGLPGMAGVVWLDDGEEVRGLTADDPAGTRGKAADVKGRTPLAALTDWLKQGPGIDAVTAVGFTVQLTQAKPGDGR